MSTVAYFCMEFGLHEEFPIYSGGLGVLAGDFIKAAARPRRCRSSASGSAGRTGYTAQRIGPDGEPDDEWHDAPPGLPRATPACACASAWPGARSPCSVWRVGRYAHRAALPDRADATRRTAGSRTGSTSRAPTAASPRRCCSASAACARSGARIPRSDLPLQRGARRLRRRRADRRPHGGRARRFADAWRAARQRDRLHHPHAGAGGQRGALARGPPAPRAPACELVGRRDARQIGGDPFNMTVAGLRLARRANAVAELHGETARAMWARRHATRRPSSPSRTACTCPPGRTRAWRGALATTSRSRLCAPGRSSSELLAEIERRTGVRLDPDVLIIGFARRAATYKRPDLDPARRRAPRRAC